MYVLDNDTFSQYLQGHPKIAARMLAVRFNSLWLPAIVVEEQIRGRMAVLAGLNPSRKTDSVRTPGAYDLLLRTLRDVQELQVLPYTAEAEALFQTWSPAVKRMGTHDCRIAAIALVSGYTVVTCNLSHFEPIPDISIEDWSW